VGVEAETVSPPDETVSDRCRSVQAGDGDDASGPQELRHLQQRAGERHVVERRNRRDQIKVAVAER
jgi:hypothetical protein